MARPGRHDHLKPEILRLIQEGLTFGEILRQYPELPKATLNGWFTQFGTGSEQVRNPPGQPRPRLPIDPESPIEKIRNALWDIVYTPEGKGTAVQALNALIKIEMWLADREMAAIVEDQDEGEVFIEVVGADAETVSG